MRTIKEQLVNISLLMPTDIHSGYSRNITLHSTQIGKMGELQRRTTEIPTSIHTASVNYSRGFLKDGDEKGLYSIAYKELEHFLSKKLMELFLYGEKTGDILTREGLLNLSKASKITCDIKELESSKFFYKTILDAVEIAIKAGSDESIGFHLLVPYNLQRSILEPDFVRNGFNLKEGIAQGLNIKITFTELIRNPIFIPMGADSPYFHCYEDIKINLKEVEITKTEFGRKEEKRLVYEGSIAGAWLICPDPKQIVFIGE